MGLADRGLDIRTAGLERLEASSAFLILRRLWRMEALSSISVQLV